MTIPILAMCGFALLTALQGTEDAHYVWRPQPTQPETVCVDEGWRTVCYTINR